MAPDFTDRIGDRINHPENVPAHLKHLIPDDVQRVKRILNFPASGRVLDVGCSDGSITRRIAERWNVEAVGADIWREWPTVWREWASALAVPAAPGPSVTYVCWDIREPHESIGQFDAVYACEVFEHLTVSDSRLALANVLAVLKPGGDLIVTVPNRHPDDIYEVGCRSRWAWPDHRQAFTIPTLDAFLSRHFMELEFWPLYDDEDCSESIWLIVRGIGKR